MITSDFVSNINSEINTMSAEKDGLASNGKTIGDSIIVIQTDCSRFCSTITILIQFQ